MVQKKRFLYCSCNFSERLSLFHMLTTNKQTPVCTGLWSRLSRRKGARKAEGQRSKENFFIAWGVVRNQCGGSIQSPLTILKYVCVSLLVGGCLTPGENGPPSSLFYSFLLCWWPTLWNCLSCCFPSTSSLGILLSCLPSCLQPSLCPCCTPVSCYSGSKPGYQ